ncbi:MAG: zinc ribbon domain-containing protein [Clostridiales bacterium]|nr:zinc ribbon domain-containing protein [Clostridiales bacterium]
MAKYCAKCSAPMEDSARFCPKCGYAPQPQQWNGGSQPFQNGGFVPQQQSYQPPFQQPSIEVV